MKEVTISEAKTRLPELLAAVERGEQITITRRSEPIARIVAFGPAKRATSRKQRVSSAFARLRAQRHGITLGGDLRKIGAEGRD